MGDVIALSKSPIDLNSDVGHAFVVDCTRAGEGLLSDKELQEKYELSPADWQNITKDMALGRAIRAERERRMLNGVAAREAACRHFVKAPGILDSIMSSENASPRHRIEAAKEIRAVASGGSGADRPAEYRKYSLSKLISHQQAAARSEIHSKEINPPTVENSPNNLIPLEGKSDDDPW